MIPGSDIDKQTYYDFQQQLRKISLTHNCKFNQSDNPNKKEKTVITFGNGSRVITIAEHYQGIEVRDDNGFLRGIRRDLSHIEIIGKKKTEKGGYKKVKEFTSMNGTIVDFLMEGKRTERSLPDPMQFAESNNSVEPYSKAARFNGSIYMSTSNIITTICCISAVEIMSDLRIKPVDPKSKNCWFKIECANSYGAIFDIVTDLEVFHPAHRYKHMISKNLRPKKSADLTKISKAELHFINWAVGEEFV